MIMMIKKQNNTNKKKINQKIENYDFYNPK